MPKILYSPASPYSAKVRMAATHLGLNFDSQIVDTAAEPDVLIANNPLGKIPVLITDSGASVYDSRAIMQYLDRVSGRKLFPRNPEKRLGAEVLEALSDGISDCLLAHVYERRSRPAELAHQPWLDKQWKKALRGLDALEANPPKTGKSPHGGHLALRAMLGYASLRFGGLWEKDHKKLVRWTKAFDAKFPELAALKPQ